MLIWACSFSCIYCQSFDKNWLLGYGINYSGVPSGGLSLLVFNQQNYDTLFLVQNTKLDLLYLYDYSCISDRKGRFAFHTNGTKVLNNDCELIENGDYINYNDIWIGDYYPLMNGTLFLPDPANVSNYYLLHKQIVYDDSFYLFVNKLLYSYIDGSFNNNKGKVTIKNKVIVADTINQSQLVACRHANGRDWWIPIRHGNKAMYYMTLLDSSGIDVHHEQEIGLKGPGAILSYNGNAVFNKNGSKYACCLVGDSIQVFDFDRCTGMLSNPIYLIPPDSLDTTVSVCFSPSGRYLYFNDLYRVWQYDLYASNIQQSGELVAVWDSFMYKDNFPVVFGQSRLAPDNRIYFSSFGASIYLHRINYPDKPSKECGFEFRQVVLSHWHSGIIPYFPNYELGAVRSSTCDSLKVAVEDIEEVEFNFSKNAITIKVLTDKLRLYPDCNLTLYDLNGKEVFNSYLQLEINIHQIENLELPAGTYFYKLRMNNEDKQITGRIIKID